MAFSSFYHTWSCSSVCFISLWRLEHWRLGVGGLIIGLQPTANKDGDLDICFKYSFTARLSVNVNHVQCRCIGIGLGIGFPLIIIGSIVCWNLYGWNRIGLRRPRTSRLDQLIKVSIIANITLIVWTYIE